MMLAQSPWPGCTDAHGRIALIAWLGRITLTASLGRIALAASEACIHMAVFLTCGLKPLQLLPADTGRAVENGPGD